MRKSYFIALLAACLLWSCSDDETGGFQEDPVEGMEEPVKEETDSYSITYQYQEDVQVLTPAKSGYIVRVEEDSILYFSKSTPDEVLPEVGDILSSRQTEMLPYGLGGSVVSVTDAGDAYRCVTTAAPLDQIFKELEFTYTQALLDTIDGFYDDEGNFHEARVVPYEEWDNPDYEADTKATIGSPNVLQIPVRAGQENGFYTSGTLSLGLIATINYSMLDNTYECSLETMGGFEANIGCGTSEKVEYEKTIFQKENLIQGVAYIGPVVLRPYVDVGLDVTAEFEGDIHTGVSKQFGLKFGFKRDDVTDGFFRENTTRPAANDLLKNLEINAQGSAALVLRAELGIGLYTRDIAIGLRPELSFGPSFDFNLDDPELFSKGSSLDIDLVADLSGIFRAALVGVEIADEEINMRSWNLWNTSFPLLPKLKENSLFVRERTGTVDLLFDAGYSLEERGVLMRFMDITPGLRVYKDEEEVMSVPYDASITPEGPTDFDFTLADLERDTEYTAVPYIELLGNSYEEEGINFSSSFPVEVTGVEVTDASYYPDHYSFNGRNYSFKYDCAVTAELTDEGEREITDWGYYYEDEYGQRVLVSLNGNQSPYTDTRFAYAKNEPEATARFGGYVHYADDENPSFDQPLEFALNYPTTSSLVLTDCVFQGTETNTVYQGRTYDYKSTFKFYFTAQGGYWLSVSPEAQGNGWNGWNLPDYSIDPVDGANVLTVNYYYDEKSFNGDYRVYLTGSDSTHGTSCQSSAYASYHHDGSSFTGCTVVGAPNVRGLSSASADGVPHEMEINLVQP